MVSFSEERLLVLLDTPTVNHRRDILAEALVQARSLLRDMGDACRARVQSRDEVIGLVLPALFADGHVLLEDHPGSGKTTLANALGGWLILRLVLLYLIKIWRRLAPRLASVEQMNRVCYRASLDRLAEVGLVREFGETREEFGGRIAQLAPEFAALTADHVRQSVGGVAELDRERWLALHEQTGRRLRSLFSRLRRWLGLANPVSWVMVR
jgi:hypothetical protein